MQKIFVDVEVTFDKDGYMHPRSITWTDGAVYEITRILDVRRSASLKAGGQGIRFLCRIGRKNTFLFFENPNWFVEGK